MTRNPTYGLPTMLLFGVLRAILLFSVLVQAIRLPESYDVVWTSQSNNSAGSMPVGGGDIGLNAWAENGDILFYISKSGTFDENNSMLKLGRIRLTFDPNPFALDSSFEQRLVINDGNVIFKGNDNTTVNLWVDVFNPIIHAEVNSSATLALRTYYENWRYEDYQIRSGEQAQSSWGVGTDSRIPNITAFADDVGFHRGGVLMSHYNDKLPLWDFQISQQRLEEFKDELYTPMRDNRFGLWMYSPQLQPGTTGEGSYINTTYRSWSLESNTTHSSYKLNIALSQNQTSDYDEWLSALKSRAQTTSQNNHADTKTWWHDYWDRSYIIINEDAGSQDPGFQVGKNYQLWRYMMGCNAYAQWPTKFNGGIFTFDPYFVNENMSFTPDYRRWGGGTFTAQNQRMLYWPLLRSGDFDVMKAQFDFYNRITPNALLRAKYYWGLNATYFNEQIDNSGLPNLYEYDGELYRNEQPRPFNFPAGECWNPWLVYQQETANEFVDMILQANIYSGLDISTYLPLIEYQLAWFDQFYQQQLLSRDAYPLTGAGGNETLVLFPASGAETYKDAYNPSGTISGLRKVIEHLMQVDQYSIASPDYYRSYLARIPETPFRLQQDRTCISPAIAYTRIQNSEPSQLYPVFPWGEFGLGLPNLTIALDTYYYDTETQEFHANEGWKQDLIWLARMGVTETATNMTEERFADSTTFRFPTFKGPHFDWTPDMNHYGAAAIGLQEQLIQTFAGNSIRLLGAWPSYWNARFKVWAPGNTTVEGSVESGSVNNLTVSPERRLADVIYGQD